MNSKGTAFFEENPVPLQRGEAMEAWGKFLPRVGEYGKRRNYVEDSPGNVSRLSVAIRHRLITEDEVIRDTLERYSFAEAE